MRIHTHTANHKPSPVTRNYEIQFTEKWARSGITQKLHTVCFWDILLKWSKHTISNWDWKSTQNWPFVNLLLASVHVYLMICVYVIQREQIFCLMNCDMKRHEELHVCKRIQNFTLQLHNFYDCTHNGLTSDFVSQYSS